MKIYSTTHADGTISYSSSPDMVKKPNDTPVVTEITVGDDLGQAFLDNPSAYSVIDSSIVKK